MWCSGLVCLPSAVSYLRIAGILKEHVFKRPFKTEKSKIEITALSQNIWQERPLQGGDGEAVLFLLANFKQSPLFSAIYYPARALRALGLLLADGAPTVGGGKTF